MPQSNTAFMGLRTAKYSAPDIAAAKAWYSKVLEGKPYFDEPFYVGFNVGGFEHALLSEPVHAHFFQARHIGAGGYLRQRTTGQLGERVHCHPCNAPRNERVRRLSAGPWPVRRWQQKPVHRAPPVQP